MINLTMHGVTSITQRRRKHHRYEDNYFYTVELTINFETWDGQKHTQHVSFFCDKPLEIEDADSTSPLTQDV
jgi:hypothetical protein